LKIVGGVYRELCTAPAWDIYLGSGGRAAAAISRLSENVELYAYCSSVSRPHAESDMRAYGLSINWTEASKDITFTYLHPLSVPLRYDNIVTDKIDEQIKITGPLVVRFGMIEEQAIVAADIAVYDPQNTNPVKFSDNGSTASRLAYVLNVSQLRDLTGNEDLYEGAEQLRESEHAEVVVVKAGFQGAIAFGPEGHRLISAYQSEQVFKIGSGDVFTAAFAFYWGERHMSYGEAADKASRTVSWYCNTRNLPVPDAVDLDRLSPLPIGTPQRVYLAGPFFTLAQRWLIEEAKAALEGLGVPVFSPIHDVGTGQSREVAEKDLAGLRASAVIYALADGRDLGTIFEVGYARACQKRIVCFGERLGNYEKTMLSGTDCDLSEDFASSIYHAAWAAMNPGGAAG
jgi:nucleoside 2-deoxyribosyltransferase